MTTIFAACMSLTAAAQDTADDTPQDKTLSKAQEEAKKAGMAKKEANLLEVFKLVNITPEEQVKMREYIKESGTYGKELRADPDFTEEEKVMKAKLYAKIKNARIRELLGDERYQLYKDVVNAQKGKVKAKK